MGFLNKIFRIYQEDNLIRFIIFNHKFTINKNNLKTNRRFLIELNKKLDGCSKETIYEITEHIVSTANLHQQTFSEFENINKDKTVFLIGAGPSLNDFEPFCDEAIYVGLNRAFKFNKVKFNYLFTIDKIGIEQYFEEFKNYLPDYCIKFIGNENTGKNYRIPEDYILNIKNIKRYNTTITYIKSRFTTDIKNKALGNFSTISLQAMQFILFTNPKKIYLVGIDCTSGKNRHFSGLSPDNLLLRNENIEIVCQNSIEEWKQLKEFVSIYYPEIEIISVNPVNLKGIFKDIYTKEGLK